MATQTRQVEVHLSATIPHDPWNNDDPRDWHSHVRGGGSRFGYQDSASPQHGFKEGDRPGATDHNTTISPTATCSHCVSSAVIGGIAAGAAGCRSGSSLGDLLDDRILPVNGCRETLFSGCEDAISSVGGVWS
jgi:hypothetical protein